MREMLGDTISWFSRMSWNILEAPEGAGFITTDCPVSFYNPCVFPPVEAGIGLAGTSVLFPISPKLMLLMLHPEYKGGGVNADALMRLVPRKREDQQINCIFWPSISAEAVQTYNSCLFLLSDRFVVSSSRANLEQCITD
jgi:hypothetical protein